MSSKDLRAFYGDHHAKATLVLPSLAAGTVSLLLIATGRYRLVRVTAALASPRSSGPGGRPVPGATLPRPDRRQGSRRIDRPATVLVVLGVGALLLAPPLHRPTDAPTLITDDPDVSDVKK